MPIIKYFLQPVIFFFAALLVVPLVTRAEVIDYQYDAGQRLSQAAFDDTAVMHYSYDGMGNRLVQTTTAGMPANQPPHTPEGPVPADGSTSVDPQQVLTWTSNDPDTEDILLHDLYFGEHQPLENALFIGLSQPSYQPGTLKSYTTYYWSVTTRDNFNSPATSPVWSFTTGNTPPYAPEIVHPANGSAIAYLNAELTWSGKGDPNPNDTVSYDLYLGQTPDPPLVASGLTTLHYSLSNLWPRGVYYWKVVTRDNHGAASESQVATFEFKDSDQDGLPDDLEQAGCTDPFRYDTDGDTIPDGQEDLNLNGTQDGGETNPCNADSDKDGMTDGLENGLGLDPLLDDSAMDLDGDGYSNLQELLEGGDPLNAAVVPGCRQIEDFESGDFSTFYWHTPFQAPWSVRRELPFSGSFSATPPSGKATPAILETWVACQSGTLSFFHTRKLRENTDWLRFYIDGELLGEWTGIHSYQQSSFTIAAGNHHFRWEFIRGDGEAGDEEQVHLDFIVFPGIPDTDGDGVYDGWELQYFTVLDHNLCTDTDNDGLSDLEEAMVLSAPDAVDSDQDGMPDKWEVDHGLNPVINDALQDEDNDGEVNISEYYGNTNASDNTAYSFSAMETFETGDLKHFHWLLSGDGLWAPSLDKPFAGDYSAQTPSLAMGGTASLETTIVCQGGVIAFYPSLLSQNNGSSLAFFIDDVLQKKWSENTSYELVTFPVTEGVHRFTWTYQQSSSSGDNDDAAWLDNIIFPGSKDSDGDGVFDGWEITHYQSIHAQLCQDSDSDGLVDLAEAGILSDPGSPDSDNDGMDDFWEVNHGLDLLVNDAGLDSDNDGATNIEEFLGGTDPGSSSSIPADGVEDFETGDFSRYAWTTEGNTPWAVVTSNAFDGQYSAGISQLADGKSSTLKTSIMCIDNGILHFHLAASTEQGADNLFLYIDDQLKGIWSGEIAFSEIAIPVTGGRHEFKWVYTKNQSGSAGQDAVWLDHIVFPGRSDSDRDVVADAWEYRYFDDTDGDGISDHWEVQHNLNPLRNDAFEDSDNDGYSNYDEFIGNSDPQDIDWKPIYSFEGFESGDFSRYHWVLAGDGHWQVNQSQPYEGSYSAQSPPLADTQSASLETTVVSQEGPIRFYVATSSENEADKLQFWIDDVLKGEWLCGWITSLFLALPTVIMTAL